MKIPTRSISLALCSSRRTERRSKFSVVGDSEQKSLLALCKLTLTEDGKVPDWVELVPAGKVTALDGRSFQNTFPEHVVSRFNEVDLDIPIDFEHSTEVKAPFGEEAPAVGWITALEVRGGSIWGQVEWNERGKEVLLAREYRYISPAFLHDNSGVVLKLESAGLTNKPALEELAAVARETPGTEEDTMNPEILAALGLSATASNVEVVAAIQALRADGQKVATDLVGVRGELEAAKEEVATARKSTPDLGKFAPRADFDTMKLRAETAESSLAGLSKEATDAEIGTEIADALKAGKITPATVDYHTAQCSQEGGLERFRDFVKAAPAVAAPSDLDNKDVPAPDGDKPTANELSIASQCGLTEENYLAHR